MHFPFRDGNNIGAPLSTHVPDTQNSPHFVADLPFQVRGSPCGSNGHG